MKKIIFPAVLALALPLFLFYKSSAFLIYRVTEIKKDYRHTSVRYALDWQVFLDYIKNIPKRLLERTVLDKEDAPYGIGLSDKETEAIKKVLTDMKGVKGLSVPAGENGNESDLKAKLEYLLKKHKGSGENVNE